MHEQLRPLLAAVQRNCHISDARHAGDYTMCVYLLKMREYFRWEKGYGFHDKLPDGEVGEWLKQREHYWQSIEDESFAGLPLGDKTYDPFDNDAVNAALRSFGLVYSGGFGYKGIPHFFLGRLGHREQQSGFTLLVSENEYARELTAPPAMSLDDTIYIRRESLRRMLWEKIEEWRWSKLENPMARALRGFDFEADAEAALEQMTDTMFDTVLLHEQGEVLAGKQLGPEWERMLASLPRSRTEIMLRAVRDHLADSLTTLPGLIELGQDAPLHFYLANLTNMQKELFPALVQAYEHWVECGSRDELASLLPASEAHWSKLARQILDCYRESPDDGATRLLTLVENNRLQGSLG